MKMRRFGLESLAFSRGYTGDSVSACITHEYGDGWVEVDTAHSAYPRAKPGLGDMVAAGLSAVGITKERVSAVVGGDCGCQKRQDALNALGRRIGIG